MGQHTQLLLSSSVQAVATDSLLWIVAAFAVLIVVVATLLTIVILKVSGKVTHGLAAIAAQLHVNLRSQIEEIVQGERPRTLTEIGRAVNKNAEEILEELDEVAAAAGLVRVDDQWVKKPTATDEAADEVERPAEEADEPRVVIDGIVITASLVKRYQGIRQVGFLPQIAGKKELPLIPNLKLYLVEDIARNNASSTALWYYLVDLLQKSTGNEKATLWEPNPILQDWNGYDILRVFLIEKFGWALVAGIMNQFKGLPNYEPYQEWLRQQEPLGNA